VDRIYETDARRVALHDDRARARAVAEEADAAHERAVGDAGRGENDSVARRQFLRRVNAARLGAPRAAAFLVFGLPGHEAREDLAVQAAHRGGREHALRRAAGPHDGVDAGADDRGRDAGRQVAVADQPDARAGPADLLDQLLVPRPIEYHDHEIFDAAIEAARDRPEILVHGRVEADGLLRARSDHQP